MGTVVERESGHEEDSPGTPSRDALSRRPWVRSLVFFLVASALAYGLEHMAEQAITLDLRYVSSSVFNVRVVYQYLVSAWPRRLVPRFTTLVTVGTPEDPLSVSLHEICAQRLLLSELVAALAEGGAAAIVIDKYFGAAACASEPGKTAALQKSVAAAASRVPVVVGLYIEDRAGRVAGDGTKVWQVVPPLAFQNAAHFRQGIVNIDTDSRRLALGWPILRADGPLGDWRNTLALETAQAYDPMLFEKYPRLARAVAARSNPYVSLIPEAEFVELAVGDVLCAWPVLPADQQAKCEGPRPPKVDPSYVRGRIVVIGEVHAMDRHATVIGVDIPGFVLQANYVEALLDERYFIPVPWWVDYLLGFLFFVAIEASLRQRSTLLCLGSVLVVIALTFLLLALTVRLLGYYLNPVTVSAFILALKLIAWSTERIVRKGERTM